MDSLTSDFDDDDNFNPNIVFISDLDYLFVPDYSEEIMKKLINKRFNPSEELINNIQNLIDSDDIANTKYKYFICKKLDMLREKCDDCDDQLAREFWFYIMCEFVLLFGYPFTSTYTDFFNTFVECLNRNKNLTYFDMTRVFDIIEDNDKFIKYCVITAPENILVKSAH